MKNTVFVVAPGVIVEDLGSDSAVFVPGVSEVLTLSGDAAEVIRRVRSGESVDGAEAVLSDLVARGVIQPVGGMSRRGVVRAGVIGAGAGVAALAMPSVAAASSPAGGGSDGDADGDTDGGGEFGRNDWFTSSRSASGGVPALFRIAYRLGAPPWGSGTLPTDPTLAGATLPAGFTEPSGLTVPGVSTPLPFHSFLNQFGGASAHTIARWNQSAVDWTPASGQIVSFQVSGVTYEVELSL